jgi:hypothetical protein
MSSKSVCDVCGNTVEPELVALPERECPDIGVDKQGKIRGLSSYEMHKPLGGLSSDIIAAVQVRLVVASGSDLCQRCKAQLLSKAIFGHSEGLDMLQDERIGKD